MNLHIPNVITIVDNKIILDERKGVNNAIIEGEEYPKEHCSLFTQPTSTGEGVTIKITLESSQQVLIDLDRNQLRDLMNLLQPYHK